MTPEEEKQTVDAAYRVARNMRTLLDVGLFPGERAEMVLEARKMAEAISDGAKAKLEALNKSQAPE